MDKKIKFTPAQLTELQSFFQKNDFTANMTLDREYDFSSKQSEIFVRAKKIFGEYWLGNLRSLGVNRKMKNFSKDYPVNFLENADADYFSKEISKIYKNPEMLNRYIDRFFEMYEEPVSHLIQIGFSLSFRFTFYSCPITHNAVDFLNGTGNFSFKAVKRSKNGIQITFISQSRADRFTACHNVL